MNEINEINFLVQFTNDKQINYQQIIDYLPFFFLSSTK